MDEDRRDEELEESGESARASEAGTSAEEPPAASRKVRRRGRRTRMRSRTIAPKRLTKEELRMGALLSDLPDVERPLARADCKGGMRPCPFVSCKHHLYLDVNPETGSIKLNFPDLEVWEMTETCALDVADRGGATLEEVGAILNLTRERIRQVEVRGLVKLKTFAPGADEIVAPLETNARVSDEAAESPRLAGEEVVESAAGDPAVGMEGALDTVNEQLPDSAALDLPLDDLVAEIAADAGELPEDLGGAVPFTIPPALLGSLRPGK